MNHRPATVFGNVDCGDASLLGTPSALATAIGATGSRDGLSCPTSSHPFECAFNFPCMMFTSIRHAAFAVPLAALFIVQVAGAQSPVRRGTADMSRAQLEARVRVADSLGLKEETYLLRTRLKNGDFEPGDRIIASYEGVGLTKFDTLVVRGNSERRLVTLGGELGELNMVGLLRSEIRDSITGRVATYYKNEIVNVVPLFRLSLAGAVRIPGVFHVRSDTPLSDVIMRTGGQDQTADLHNVVIKRGDQIVWGAEDVTSALSEGLTIEGLDLQPGDEIEIGARSQKSWTTYLPYVVPVITAIVISMFVKK